MKGKKMSLTDKVKIEMKLNKILNDLRMNSAKQELLLEVLRKYKFEDLAELLDELKDYYM